MALIGINTDGILRQARYVDDSAARRRVIKDLLWEEMDVTDSGELVTTIGIIWRGTARRVELVFGNVRDEDACRGSSSSRASPARSGSSSTTRLTRGTIPRPRTRTGSSGCPPS